MDAAGNSAALKTALDSVRRLGTIVKIGWGPRPFDGSLDTLLRKSARLVGTFGHNWPDWEAVLKLMGTGQIRAKPLITGVLPLLQWREAFEQAERLEAIKILLRPGGVMKNAGRSFLHRPVQTLICDVTCREKGAHGILATFGNGMLSEGQCVGKDTRGSFTSRARLLVIALVARRESTRV